MELQGVKQGPQPGSAHLSGQANANADGRGPGISHKAIRSPLDEVVDPEEERQLWTVLALLLV